MAEASIHVIPAEAVEAAAKAFIEHGALLEALEAAAPHMLAESFEQGRDTEFQRSVMKRQTDPNPYRPTP